MKNFIEAAQYAFAALGGALGAVMGGFDGFLYALVVFVVVDYITGLMAAVRRRGARHGGGRERQAGKPAKAHGAVLHAGGWRVFGRGNG